MKHEFLEYQPCTYSNINNNKNHSQVVVLPLGCVSEILINLLKSSHPLGVQLGRCSPPETALAALQRVLEQMRANLTNLHFVYITRPALFKSKMKIHTVASA